MSPNSGEGGIALGGSADAAAEFPGEGFFAEIGDVGGHAGDGEAAGGDLAGTPVGAAVIFRVGEDGLAADFVEGDVLGGVEGGRRDGHAGENHIGEGGGPFERLHAAHGPADDGKEAGDAETVDQAVLGVDHVLDGDGRKICAPNARAVWPLAAGAGAAEAATEDVGADDIEAVGVRWVGRVR